MTKIKYRYWNATTKVMVDNPMMPYKENWTIEQLFSERGWHWLQFTGQTDVDGKEIFEGDILEAIAHTDYKDEDTTAPVVRSEQGAWVVQSDKNNNVGLHLWWGGWRTLRVIGNIYQNPELLK